MSNEEVYSYKTPSSQLVQIAEIASRYKGRPEMLMKVVIQTQKIVTAFSASVAAVMQERWRFRRHRCTVL